MWRGDGVPRVLAQPGSTCPCPESVGSLWVYLQGSAETSGLEARERGRLAGLHGWPCLQLGHSRQGDLFLTAVTSKLFKDKYKMTQSVLIYSQLNFV